MSVPTTFTGRTRQRRTKWTVRAADTMAHGLIVAGGIGTIVAVSMVCVFLVWSVLPLFRSATSAVQAKVASPWSKSPDRVAVNEHGLAGWALSHEKGEVEFFRLDH